MPKRLLQRCLPDSVGEFRAAARRRFEDGEALAAAGQRTAAIYLWGYAAEMTLKAAFFSFIGYADDQPIPLPDIRAAVASAAGLGVIWPGPPGKPKNSHSLQGWAELLIAKRGAMGSPYPPAFGRAVAERGRRLELLWREVLRYHKNVAYLHEVRQVRGAADWLLRHARGL
jgi:hypothetical protein